MMQTLLSVFILFTFTISLTSCSRLEVAYKFADNYATSKADDYFDLTSQQKKQLKSRIQNDLNTARTQLFPEFALQLRELEAQIQSGSLEQEKIQKNIETFKQSFWKLIGVFKNTVVLTIQDLSSKQFEEFDEEVQENIEDSKDLKEANEKINKRYRRNTEMWIGGINKAQRQQIENFLIAHPYPFELQAQNKEHILKQFQKARQQPEELEKFLNQYFTSYETLRLPAYGEALDKFHKNLMEFALQEFLPTMTARQKDNLRESLKTRAEQLEKLSKNP